MKESKLIITGITEKGRETLKNKNKGLKLMKLAFKTAGIKIGYSEGTIDYKEFNTLIFSSKKRKIEKSQLGMITQDFKVSGCKEGIDYKIEVTK